MAEVIEIPLSTPVGELEGHTLLELEGRHVVLSRRHGGYMHWYGTRSHDDKDGARGAPPSRSIADLAGLVLHQELKRAFQLPKGRVVHVPAWHRSRRWVWSLAATLSVTLVVVVVVWVLASHRVIVLKLRDWVFLSAVSLAFLCFQGENLFGGHRMMYRTSWRRWELVDLVAAADRNDLAERQVQAVKEAYGMLLTDLVYRVEHPALFDTECPATEPFSLALVEWDTTQQHLERAARSALASRVVATFQQARHHAERVGMEHLPRPQRRVVRRAAKALRVASDPYATSRERSTALERAVKLLDDLVLHYMPTGPEIRQAVGVQHRRQLPGRRTR